MKNKNKHLDSLRLNALLRLVEDYKEVLNRDDLDQSNERDLRLLTQWNQLNIFLVRHLNA